MKIISSPVKEFPGSVSLPDHLILPQCLDLEGKIDKVKEMVEAGASRTLIDAEILPLIFSIVEKWDIEGVTTLETFPMTPRLASTQLIGWLYSEIISLYTGEVTIPNA